MNIHWKRQKANGNGKGVSLCAVLTEDRQDNGRKGRTFQLELGSIEERFLATKIKGTRAFHQGLFWVHVDRNLDKLGLDSGVRDQIERQLAERISRPDEDWAMWGVICVPKFDSVPNPC